MTVLDRTPVRERHIRLSESEVAGALVDVLGAPLVAMLGGVQNTRAVRQWVNGERSIQRIAELRFALHIADVLLARERADVVRAWFLGLNRDLDDENPALLISRRPDHDTKKKILAAARSFIAEH